jgi:hypothetical protein
MPRFLATILLSLALCLAGLASRAHAANVLVVSDSTSDSTLGTILMADGHTVTTVTSDFSGGSNTRLRMPLDDFDVVVWSATGPGYGEAHTDAAVFTNLTTYVMDGGRVFVTGYDSVASPTDPMLLSFLGGAGARDVPGAPGAIIMAENSLTIGLVDIRGVTPTGGSGDRDAITTPLGADTVGVCPSSGSTTEWQWTLRTLGSGEIAYVSNGDSSSTTASWSSAVAGGAGAYNAALRNFVASGDSASGDPGSPEIEFVSDTVVDEGGELVLTVMVSDPEGDTFTFSWDLDDDGTFGEMAGATSYTIAAGTTDGPDSRRVAVRAVDSAGHTSERRRTIRIVNVEPTITSEPPTSTSVGAMLRYQLEVEDPGGDGDPLTYAVVVGPSRATVSPTGLFAWVPNETDVTIGSETVHVEVQVDDGDEGIATQVWDMTVSPNRAPSNPALIYPVSGIVIAETEPRLVVQNAEDPDLDPLTYHFEIDTVDTFDSPALLASDPIPEMPGFTSYHPGTLTPGTHYYWRAWVSDGMVETDPGQAEFSVGGDAPTDGGTSGGDGGSAVADGGTITPPPRDRGGCAVSGSSSRGPAWLVFALLAIGVGRRARRR